MEKRASQGGGLLVFGLAADRNELAHDEVAQLVEFL